MNLRKSSVSSHPDKDDKAGKMCGTCERSCKETDKFLVCTACSRKFHIACQKVSEEKYVVIKSEQDNPHPTIRWYCNSSCSFFAAHVLDSITDIRRNLISLKDEIDKTNATVAKLDCAVSDMDRGVFSAEHSDEIKRLTREEIETHMSERLSAEELALHSPTNQVNFEEAVSTAVKEMNERQFRKKSFIVHGIPMSKSKELKSRIEHDKTSLENLCKDGLKLKQKIVVQKVSRLGKKDDKDRPMRVYMDNAQSVSEIISAAKNLKGNADYKEVSIASDRTPLERRERRKLQELREMKQAMSDQQQDGVKWIIRGNRVVKELAGATDSDSASQTQEGAEERWE